MSWRRIAADKRRSGGFVLLEVLVAVAVAAILMAALMRSFTTTWLGINAVREEAESMLVARTMLAAAAPRINTAEGEQTGTAGRYAWRIAVTKPLAEAALFASPNAAAPGGNAAGVNSAAGPNTARPSAAGRNTAGRNAAGGNAAGGNAEGANPESPPGEGEAQEFAWTLFRVVITVRAPSGRSTSLETFRLSKPAG